MQSTVLHVVEPEATAWPVLAALAGAPGGAVALLASSPGVRWAREMGVREVFAVHAPLGWSVLGWRGLRAADRRPGAPGAVRAWSLWAGAAAILAFPGRPVHLTLADPVPRRACTPAIRWVFGRAASISFTSVRIREAWSTHCPQDARALPLAPLPAPQAASPAQRAAARTRWGVDDQTQVVWAASDRTNLADARVFVWHLGVMAVAGRRVAGLVPASARKLERALRFTERHAGAWRLIVDDAPPTSIAPGCDAALAASPWCTESARLAAALNLPWIGSNGPAAAPPLEVNRALLAALERSRL